MSVFQTVQARCYRCGRSSIADGAYSPRKDITVQLAKGAGWVFLWDDDSSPVCPPCQRKGSDD